MNEIKNYKSSIDQQKFGGKAFWLSWLEQNNFLIPPAVFIPANFVVQSKSDLKKLLTVFFDKESNSQSVKFAVRSSGINEDSFTSSQAGLNNSLTRITTIESAINKIPEIQNGKNDIGVIIQEYIEASYSGVIFSTNPNTGNKNDILINFTSGNSEDLLNGKIKGQEIEINYSVFNNKTNKIYPLDFVLLQELILITKKIETLIKYPVDIEWCVNKNTNKLYIIQCRPITNLQFKKSELIPVCLESKNKIPKEIQKNDKVKLRLDASINDVLATKTYLLLMNQNDLNKFNILEEVNKHIIPNQLNLGYCKVVIQPNTINGGVLRRFSACSNAKLANGLNEMLIESFKEYWQAAIIFHELFDLHYMGIIKKINTDYLIEISYGGFIQKGITESSQFIVNKAFEIESKNESIQEYKYEIDNGNIKKTHINKKIKLSNEVIIMITKTFKPYTDKNLTLEFGISKCVKNFTPYLIDYIEDKTNISRDDITEGNVSKGRVSGKIKNIIGNEEWLKSIQTHFHDGKEYGIKSLDKTENIIFVVDKPHISLVELIDKYDKDKIGFIFKEAAILSHFCILLRENKIPAIISSQKFKDNEIIDINT